MTGPLSISRRKLMVGGLMVAFACSARARAATSEATGPSAIGGFVRISQEGGISLVMPSVEMGQGIYTAEAALLAGSGSAVFGIFDSGDAQERAIQAIELEAGWRVFPCRTVGRNSYRSAMGAAGEIFAKFSAADVGR